MLHPVSDVFYETAFAGRVEARQRLVYHQHIRRFQQCTRQAQFLTLNRRQAAAGDAHFVTQTRLDNVITQVQAFDHIGDQVVYLLLGMRLSVGELSEEDIVLDRDARVVAGLVEKLDAEILILRKLMDFAARIENALLDGFGDQAQAMTCHDESERQ